MDGFNSNQNNEYSDQNSGYANPGYTNPEYSTPTYSQDVYTQTPNANVYGTQPTYQAGPTRCPGKEIAGLALGINSLVWGVLGAAFSFMPIYGIIFGIIWGGFGIGFGVAANILHKKVHEQATEITNKIEIGKKLATAGMIVSAIAIALGIVVSILFTVGIATLGVFEASQNGTF